ncbi:UNVERIFIED_CONTAM: hypothetical protein NCL1_45850 [Trichonephila clavipes]
MPLRTHSARAFQRNVKRWRKENSEREGIQNSNVQNVGLEKLNTVVKKDTSDVVNYILVDYNQVNNLLRNPFSSTTYGKCARRLNIAYTLASENIYAEIHREIKHAYKNGAEITDLSVSCDGTWLTHGQTSLIDVGCIIDMLTGYVVDFGVMSKKAILKNKEDVNAMKTTIYATLLHSISTDAKPQHSKCPAGENS